MFAKNSFQYFLFLIVLIGTMSLLLTGCAKSIDITECVVSDSYGFFGGLWHGIISPISFIISLFSDKVEMYAVNNNGGWYDFGFVLGAGILFGGGSSRWR